MALVKKRTSPTRAIIIAVVVLVVGGAGWFLIQQFLVPGGGLQPGTTNQSKPVITNFGEDILTDKRYRDLKSFGEVPNVNLDTAGNPNPFQ